MDRIYVVLALGSNLGDRLDNLRRAVSGCGEILSDIVLSRVYESPPMYKTDQPEFLNMALSGYYVGSAESLLGALKGLELSLGRVVGERYGSREIDLDIIFFGNMIYRGDGLEIPHSRMHERDFVLLPLMDICGDFVHPILQESVIMLSTCVVIKSSLYVSNLHIEEVRDV